MKNEKTPERLAVERAIQKAREPITVSEIQLKTELHGDTIRTHINNCLNNGLIRNTCPGKKPSAYLWGAVPAPQPARVNEPRSCLTFGTYTGSDLTKPPAREAGMIAFTIPSKGDTERRRPILIASSAESLPKST